MGTDNSILFLIPPLIIAVVIGLMIGWEIGLASGSFAGLVVLFVEASKLNTSPIYGYAGIVVAIVFVLTTFDSARRILRERGIKEKSKRLINEISTLRQRGVKLINEGLAIRNDADKNSWWQQV